VVQKIDESSRQLAEALESAVPVIITTLQKFPFVSRQLLKMAEERGATSSGTLPTRHCAVIIDEAHSSQGGETATELKEVLGGAGLRAEAQRQAAEEGLDNMEELLVSMAKRGRQANLSFFAFTATPKHKTLAVFGHDGQPTHRYTMRQAIEEAFILDVLKHYTTYATYFKLLKACNDDPNVERKKAAQALARFMRLHPHNIAQKTEVMVEHFNAMTRHKIGGRAKAMAVTGSRLEAVRYKQSFDRYIQKKGYAIKTLVAFSDKAPFTPADAQDCAQGAQLTVQVRGVTGEATAVACIDRLKALYAGFQDRELARILFFTFGYPIPHNTDDGSLFFAPLRREPRGALQPTATIVWTVQCWLMLTGLLTGEQPPNLLTIRAKSFVLRW
jgi:SWI2/SNF2 ATPase